MVDDNSVVNCEGTVKVQLFGKTHRFSDCRWEKSQASNQNLISLNIVVDPRGVGQQHSSGRGIPTLFPSRPQLRFCPHPVELLSSPGRRQLPTCPPAMSPPSSWASPAAAAPLLLPSLQGPQVQFFPSFWYEKRATLCCPSLSALYAAYIQFISSTSWIFHCWSGLTSLVVLVDICAHSVSKMYSTYPHQMFELTYDWSQFMSTQVGWLKPTQNNLNLNDPVYVPWPKVLTDDERYAMMKGKVVIIRR